MNLLQAAERCHGHLRKLQFSKLIYVTHHTKRDLIETPR